MTNQLHANPTERHPVITTEIGPDPNSIGELIDLYISDIPTSYEEASLKVDVLRHLDAQVDKEKVDPTTAQELHDLAEQGIGFWRMNDEGVKSAKAIDAAKTPDELPDDIREVFSEVYETTGDSVSDTLKLYNFKQEASKRLNLHEEIVEIDANTNAVTAGNEEAAQLKDAPTSRVPKKSVTKKGAASVQASSPKTTPETKKTVESHGGQATAGAQKPHETIEEPAAAKMSITESIKQEPAETVAPANTSERGVEQLRYRNGAMHFYEVGTDGKKHHVSANSILAAYDHEGDVQGNEAEAAIKRAANYDFSVPLKDMDLETKAAYFSNAKIAAADVAEESPRENIRSRMKRMVASGRSMVLNGKVEAPATARRLNQRTRQVYDRGRNKMAVAYATVGNSLITPQFVTPDQEDLKEHQKKGWLLVAAVGAVAVGSLYLKLHGMHHGSGPGVSVNPPETPSQTGGTQGGFHSQGSLTGGQGHVVAQPVAPSHVIERKPYDTIKLHHGQTIWGREEVRHPQMSQAQILQQVEHDLRLNDLSWEDATKLADNSKIKLARTK